jgi:hypothetical protein
MNERARMHTPSARAGTHRLNPLAEGGSTLIELLVAAAMMISVMGALLGLNRVAFKEQDRIEGGVRGLIAQKNGLERMTREMRQADTVCDVYPSCAPFTNSSRVEFQRCRSGGTSGCTLYWVRYDCTGAPAQPVPPNLTTRACLRSEAATPALLGQNQRVVVRNISTTQGGVFSFVGTSYVTISLKVVAKGQKHPISLEDGVRTRNVNEVPDSGESA